MFSSSPLPKTPPTTPIISLNRFIFSGIRTKPSRDDIYRKISTPDKKFLAHKKPIFVWPPKRTTTPFALYNREFVWICWLLVHGMYWLHVMKILPSGTAVPLKKPEWKQEPRIHRPKSRDFIIEPDWDSYITQ